MSTPSPADALARFDADLADHPGLVRAEVPIGPLTTYRVGGPAARFALVDDEEATLKRLRKRGASVALEAANPAYETRIFGPDRVQIQGRLVALLRRY